ncbi:hypothetical protein [Microbacterium sp.]|uniref:hypothetical protein n=1 Tax=Microbacterium sp. TaxID=51671 RepID=UPI00273606B3|nr:hypothetical protein [Microbacterium sp.]MDP3951887.1 hypothetical protein [Microbacterium sp.]
MDFTHYEPPTRDEPPFPDPLDLRFASELSSGHVSQTREAAPPKSTLKAGTTTTTEVTSFLAPTLVAAQLTNKGVSAHPTSDGGVAVRLEGDLVALQLPADRPAWLIDAADITGVNPILDRVAWVEQVGSSLYLFARMTHPDLLAAHTTFQNGTVVAKLLTEGEVVLGDVARGERGELAVLSAEEALRTGDFLDWASDVPSAPTPQAIDIRALTRDVALVRDGFNRTHSNVELRDGVVYRAFDLLDNDPDAAAVKLLEDGHVEVTRGALRAASISKVIINRPVDEVVRRIVDVVIGAAQEADPTLPLVLAEPGAKGAPARLVSVTPAGEVVRWDSHTDLHTLVLLAVQPMLRGTEGERYANGVPATLLGRIGLELRAAARTVDHIVFEPTLIGDSVVDTPGYHAAARTVLTMSHRDRHRWAAHYDVPASSTVEEAQKSFDFLDTELCGSFPWAEDRDRARMMAALLTGAARSAITNSPGFLWDANEIGTGKSQAAAAIRLLAQGTKNAAGWALGRGLDEESSKRLASALLTRSTRFWHCDEVRGPINSPAVGEVITAGDGSATIRELGANREVVVRGIIVTACGNNIRIADDHARRWLTMRMEKPLLQMASGGKYRHADLDAYIMKNRPQLVAAAHTLVLRAIQSGPAHPVRTLGLAPSWSERILGALTWVRRGETTVATQVMEGWEKDVSGADHHVEEWGDALAYVWAHLFSPVSASEFAAVAFTSKTELALPDELVAATRRQLGTRWSRALKNLRGKKLIVGNRVYRVVAEDSNGRWLFDVEAFDLDALLEHDETPLVRPPLDDAEQRRFTAAATAATKRENF